MFFSQGIHPYGTYYTQGSPRGIIQTKTSRGEEPRNKEEENSPAGPQMGLGFANRNIRKDVHVRREVDASLTILMLNACSLMNKIDKLITIVQTYKPHIVAITDTWLHDQMNDAEIAINDYHIFRNDREGRGGGALLLIKSSLRPKQQIQLQHDGKRIRINMTKKW